MQWIVPEKFTPAEAEIVARLKRRSQFFVFLRTIRAQLFNRDFQEKLAEGYAPRGQTPIPPALLAMVCLLQAYTGVSDAEAVEAAEMDSRWKLVLGTLDRDSAPFGQGSIFRFRSRMIAHNLDQALLERTVALAKETGGFGWQKLKVVLDSSPLRGAGRVEDTWNLIGHSMSDLVEQFIKLSNATREEIVQAAGLSLLEKESIKSALDINWDEPAERSLALTTVISQASALLEWAKEHLPDQMKEPQIADAVDVLQRIIESDTEPDPDHPQGHRVKEGVASDRVCSVGDPEMRHGRKSKKKAFNGYKRHVGAYSDAPFIFAAEAFPANAPESNATPLLLDALGDVKIDELMIDRGYISHERVAELSREGTTITCRPWAVKNRKGRFSKDDFSINLRTRTVTCPAGELASFPHQGSRATFDAGTCLDCTLREQCTASKAGRSVEIHKQESLQKKLRKLVRKPSGRKRLRERVGVEHRLARISQFQGNTARYKGTRNNTFDLRRHAAVANLVELRSQIAA